MFLLRVVQVAMAAVAAAAFAYVAGLAAVILVNETRPTADNVVFATAFLAAAMPTFIASFAWLFKTMREISPVRN